MVTNFDYLKNESKFSAFANVAISAEKIILADPDASILNSRRAIGICCEMVVFCGEQFADSVPG